MEKTNELYDRLLETTTEIFDAASVSDIDRLARAIEMRKPYVAKMSAVSKTERTQEEKEKINQIILLDKKADRLIKEIFQDYKETIKNSRVKYEAMLTYNNGRFDLTNGHLLDKKR